MKSTELFHKGAEASLYRGEWFGRQAVIKVRHPRTYRHPSLDYKLRIIRTARETNIISASKKANIKVPLIYEVDFDQTTLIMEYIKGSLLRDVISKLPKESLIEIFSEVGVSIGRLHNFGIVHGDLTTSNMIYSPDQKLYLIDFGLAGFSTETESRGVDLLLAKRTLNSTHPTEFDICFDALISKYNETVPTGSVVISKITEIEKRGRYAERT